jgi:hypothetical protein
MHQDVRIGAAVRILTNRDLCEDRAIPRLESLSVQLHQVAEHLRIRVVAQPCASPVDVDAEVERMSDLLSEPCRRSHLLNMRLSQLVILPAGRASGRLQIVSSTAPIAIASSTGLGCEGTVSHDLQKQLLVPPEW